MKIFPSGLGIWIWKINQCDGGNWDKIITRCKNAGIRWVAIKSGDAVRNIQFSTANAKKIIDICHKNDILVYTWNYSKPSTYEEEITHIKSLFDDGIDGHIIDAEAEWQMYKDNKAIAVKFLTKLRELIGDGFIAHSPFPIIEYHAIFPYIEFGKYCDAVMPQSYWTEINWTCEKTLNKTDKSWNDFNSSHPDVSKPVYPIGVTYGQGYPKVPGELKKEDIKMFLHRYPNLPISLYSYDASMKFSWIWDVLAEEDSINKKLPLPPLIPIIIDIPGPAPVIDTSVTDAPLPIPQTIFTKTLEHIKKLFKLK